MTALVEGPLLTAREVAEELGVSTETILRWTRDGKIPAVRLPSGALRYRCSELLAWIDERATLRSGACHRTRPNAAHGGGYRGTIGSVTEPEGQE
jgi:excisionase family DNA binding protein